MSELYLSGKATDLIWLMEDGEEPNIIGIRLDCGDSGVVYVTRDQARDLSKQLAQFCGDVEPPNHCLIVDEISDKWNVEHGKQAC